MHLPSLLRILAGFLWLLVSAPLHAAVLVLLMPSRLARIRSCNLWGWVNGRVLLWIGGARLQVQGREHLRADRPAIYVSNHTTIHDIFLGIHLGPLGVVGVAKKEVVYYPLFGQLYWLSGHLRIDRGDHGRAVAAMTALAELVRRHRLSIWMWPEGTRSRDGRLLPFRKGIWHLAVETGLPIVPVVVRGGHEAWGKGTLRLRPVTLEVDVLPALDTSDWAGRDKEACVAAVRQVFLDRLPADQQPLPTAGEAAPAAATAPSA